ncbi:MAG: electron transport complex subunit E [Pseudobutyrivibrio sp.]|nr:electron transport complex subunit E [Pseudobutyrivibrio sp.]
MNKYIERIYNGVWKENPTFVLMLGMCPTLAVTTSAINGIGMGLSTTVVLILSNMMISALRNIIPDRVRMPAFIVVVASFVTMVDFLMQGFVPSLYDSLGIYIPLIVVNCIILGRAESYASKNPIVESMFDGIGMGLGFTIGLTLIGSVREILGNGSIFDVNIAVLNDYHITLFGLAPGAFFVLSILVALMNIVRKKMEEKGKPLPPVQGCLAGDCRTCTLSSGCTGKATITKEVLPPVNPKDVAKPVPDTRIEVEHTSNTLNTIDVEKSGSDSSYADDDIVEKGKEES